MHKLFLAAFLLAASIGAASGQSVVRPCTTNGSQCPTVSTDNPMPMYGAFTQTARAPDLSAGVATSSVALGAVTQTARVCNTSATITAYVAMGSSTVTATVAGSIPLFPNSCINLFVGSNTHLAGITVSSTASILTSLGTGVAALGGSGAGGGSGTPGGSDTQLQYNNAGAFRGISGWTTDGANTLTGGSGTIVTIGGTAILTSPTSAVLQFGAAAVDTGPVNQTIQAQGVITGSGTSNVAGANLTLAAGQGKGNAAGSLLNFQAPVAVASGTGAQTMTTIAYVDTNGLTLPGTTATVGVRLARSAFGGIYMNDFGVQLLSDVSSNVNFTGGDFRLAGTTQKVMWNADTNWSRKAAGVIQAGTTAANNLGTIDATAYQAGGTAGIAACTAPALGATITIKGGLVTAFTGC